jgi:hypothetical protein
MRSLHTLQAIAPAYYPHKTMKVLKNTVEHLVIQQEKFKYSGLTQLSCVLLFCAYLMGFSIGSFFVLLLPPALFFFLCDMYYLGVVLAFDKIKNTLTIRYRFSILLFWQKYSLNDFQYIEVVEEKETGYAGQVVTFYIPTLYLHINSRNKKKISFKTREEAVAVSELAHRFIFPHNLSL